MTPISEITRSNINRKLSFKINTKSNVDMDDTTETKKRTTFMNQDFNEYFKEETSSSSSDNEPKLSNSVLNAINNEKIG